MLELEHFLAQHRSLCRADAVKAFARFIEENGEQRLWFFSMALMVGEVAKRFVRAERSRQLSACRRVGEAPGTGLDFKSAFQWIRNVIPER